MKESYNRDPLVAAAESMMLTEDVAKIKNKVAQLEVGDKTNYGTVVAIGSDSITFKAKDTPKTKIVFRQRKMGSPDYLLMNLVKLTPDGKKLDKTFKEANDFTGAAAAAAVAGEDEFEFKGKTYPVEIDLEVAKKIMSQSLKLAKQLAKDMDEDVDFIESNEFVGAAAAAKVAGKDEFEFKGKTYPVEISQETAEKIMSQAIDLAKDIAKAKKEESTELEEGIGSLQNSLRIISNAGFINRGFGGGPMRFQDADIKNLAKVIYKNYKAITGEKYVDADQVAMSEPIADLIGFLRINGDKFIAAWDKTIKESTELAESVSDELEIDEMKMDDPKLNKIFDKLKKGQTIKLKTSSTISKGKDFVDYIVKSKNTVNKGRVEKVTLVTKGNEKSVKKFLYKRDGKVTFAIGDMGAFIDDIKEELEEEAGGEWFTCEIHVKSSGQLYSTFYVQAKDMGEAKRKADKVFLELMKTSYPKNWPNAQKKFTVKVMKGDNIGELMP